MPGEDRDGDALDAIHRAMILFSRGSRVRSNELYEGLGFVQYTMLSSIDLADCAHAADLAQEYGLDPSTVSRQLAELENAGLLVRGPDPRHSRRQRLELTEAGHRALAITRAAQRDRLEERLRDWPRRDVAEFGRLLSRFVGS
ncbi:MarR family winged helix-turn-helix transcriptional regulator [Amycolatopsis rubida]|uniref:DNA-binding transcriptional regulator, MarR family n=1 Tax=Amycolatopsis rubida TaxID=112413 RepID=A0A1I5L918_9PSEU|nr:MarR family winged helix-turn-helix transcriptional regulator [Amycolatopsis rubida]SFO93693.1 DNA-binding transcriptional regulator, MarR family [Amycolatopsis rubida]